MYTTERSWQPLIATGLAAVAGVMFMSSVSCLSTGDFCIGAKTTHTQLSASIPVIRAPNSIQVVANDATAPLMAREPCEAFGGSPDGIKKKPKCVHPSRPKKDACPDCPRR